MMSVSRREKSSPDNRGGSSEEPYHRLAEHLDRLPGGFSPSKTGAHIRLLKKLFTPEEAELATHLTLDQEDAETIAGKTGLSATQTEKLLDEMAMKGLIFSVQAINEPTLYQAIPWVIGIYELQVNNLNEDLIEALNEYWSTAESREKPWKPQLRTIPIGQSIEPTLEVLPYEQVEELVEENDTFAVAPCICRSIEKKQGRGCDAPIETCLIFGDFADFYVKTGLGRYIDNCCGCCCGVLRGLQHAPKPAEAVVSSFIAQHDPEACIGCGICLERCQMQAITEEGAKVSLNADRCIGCGLCVSTCPTGALSLVRKPGSSKREIPATFYDTWYKISEEMSQKR